MITLYRYDAFSTVPGRGNPAGVVLETEHLTEEQMQKIAKEAAYSETAFVLPSDKADLRLRYFTPGAEVPLCGHATVGSIYALHEKGLIGEGEITIETGAGVMPISVTVKDGRTQIGMTQAVYQEKPFRGDKAALAASIGLTEDELDGRYPIMYGYTGLWTVVIPVKHLESFAKMKPDHYSFPGILTDEPYASMHPFCLETVNEGAMIHARHFSSPKNNIGEDPVTGTASGVMGAYWKRHIAEDGSRELRVICEQGLEIGKDGIVETLVPADPDGQVQIFGTAVFAQAFDIEP
ncbi:MAG: PhzF family phenazine biosynthesis isomerase [Firmicutes bacterium]|nr:PhzF family phenazine biosynthesis isomerase [Bacillota bacterium]